MFKGIVLLFLALCAAFSSAACSIAITNLQMTDGKVVTPWTYTSPAYGVNVSWTVTGTPNAPYAIKFQIGDQTLITKNVFGGGSGVDGWALTYPTLMPLPVTVTIDPAGVSGNTTPATATISKTFTPIPPTTAVANFAPHVFFGKQTLSVPITAGTMAQIVLTLGMPVTQTFQSVATDTATGTTLISQPTHYPVSQAVFNNVGPGTYTITQNFKVTVANVACNFSLIKPTWAQIDALKTQFGGFLGAEPNLEIADPNVVALTNAALPANYRVVLTPLQVSEKLYQAVVSKVTYQVGVPGDASSVVVSKLGDCGGMSDLFNACLRLVGIPSRLTAGWDNGGNTHAWAEFYLPGPGWIPADPSFGKGVSATGAFLPYFGFHTASNNHCSVYRGGEVNTPLMPSDFLQIGQVSLSGGATAGPVAHTVALSTTPIP